MTKVKMQVHYLLGFGIKMRQPHGRIVAAGLVLSALLIFVPNHTVQQLALLMLGLFMGINMSASLAIWTQVEQPETGSQQVSE